MVFACMKCSVDELQTYTVNAISASNKTIPHLNPRLQFLGSSGSKGSKSSKSFGFVELPLGCSWLLLVSRSWDIIRSRGCSSSVNTIATISFSFLLPFFVFVTFWFGATPRNRENTRNATATHETTFFLQRSSTINVGMATF